ncbi:hypothetical protein CHLNCDRAFT_138137 [Chlorella variabilis]|uniref:GH16 domain-containing protein n=1 Tax=Chlorella variabilis TaxID=554065 RepID=E1Z5C6_CHLVA|nr:hypothetical protein CHLNCDRAFT_138137 [Chlorella variabilis]EFN59204.1 hypothetical protein CHLNCDRAFT_138137 [Chlorella variabilis]|eukprot:XP_005851306.1 hypothetical protein CHLNCDRAFT_138137 [Chlorella variabilis]
MLLLAAVQGALLLRLAAADCRSQLLQAAPSSSGKEGWIDVDSPVDSCTKQLDGFDGQYQLVFSDEFNTLDRDFKAAAQDGRWTAQHQYYFPTKDEEVYRPEQVTVEGGAAVITLERLPGNEAGTAPSQQPDGEVWQVSKKYVSGMFNSWNKFCYTGGYIEAAVQLPGNAVTSGFWPAFWTMGNLGRAGYMASTAGTWPYSYNTCQGSGKQEWSGLEGQLITACPGDPPGVNRAAWGLHPQQGRGAPEFDVFETRRAMAGRQAGRQPAGNSPGGVQPPHASQTLQMAPLMPEGTNWWSGPASGGVQYPGAGSPYATRRNPWSGALQRPGNEYQDSVSALSDLGPSYYTGYHTYGVDWRPGQYLRWYLDGVLLYEVNSQALVEQTNATGAWVGPRLIPLEPMYVIFNLGMSEAFGEIQYGQLPFPAAMKVDWVRVYQRPDAINVGCSPPDFPTAQYIACNRHKFVMSEEEEGMLVREQCSSNVVGAAAGRAPLRGLLHGGLAAAASALLALAP